MNTPATSTAPPAGRNLVVCLDGTWNNKDSSTNVLHLYHLATGTDSHDVGGAGQLKYYDEGVGTGLLDVVSGGAFGVGLEINVREAYNWLVRHYEPGDRIFLFGFSRGAYTARSLAGFITHCGLLKRGAPMTVGQLWTAYGQIAREAAGDKSWWEELVGVRPLPWRSRVELERDGEAREVLEEGMGQRAGEKSQQPTDAEQMLMASTWDGVSIHFLGIFDTVGSMGIDALAVPGVRGRLALVHNMDLSPLLVTVRHALALDENRDSFLHTPLRHVSSSGIGLKTEQSGGVDIVQRWFPGAHSNIGGGYEDGTPSGHVHEWMLGEAVKAGLKLSACDKPPMAGEDAARMAGRLRDSYMEFASPIWAHVLRGKRCYRRVAPPEELRGRRDEEKEGERLTYPCEEVDGKVWEMVNAVSSYCPVGLQEYAARVPAGETAGGAEQAARAKLAQSALEARPPWLGRSLGGGIWLAVWSVLATLGLAAACWLFFPGSELPQWGARWPWLAFAHAVVLVLVDWWENRLNYSLSLRPGDPAVGEGRPWSEAWLDCIFWLRAGGVLLCLTGAGWLVWQLGCFILGMANGGLLMDAAWWARAAAGGALVAIAAGASVCSTPHRLKKPGGKLRWLPATVAAVITVAALVQWQPLSGWEAGKVLEGERVASRLLLLAMLTGYFWNSFLGWVGEPMRNSRLGSVADLQGCWSGSRVKEVFSAWTARLTPPGQTGDAPRHWMQHNVRLCLVRDWMGFIPLYTVFLGTGMWFAQDVLYWFSLPAPGMGWLPHWGPLHDYVWLAVLAAGADAVENAFHWRYVRRPDRAPSNAGVWLCQGFVVVKFLAFLSMLWMAYLVMQHGTWLLTVHSGEAGFRGVLALGALTAVLTQTILWLTGGVKKVAHELVGKLPQQKPGPLPSLPAAPAHDAQT